MPTVFKRLLLTTILTLSLLGSTLPLWLNEGISVVQAQAGTGVFRVATTGSDVSTCGSEAVPCRTIQYAVDLAGNNDEIQVAAGSYTDITGRSTPAGYPNPPASGVISQVVYLDKSITLRGGYTTTDWTTPDPTAHPTIIDAQNQGRVLVIAGNITPLITGFHLVNGDAAGLQGFWTGSDDAGGGVYALTALPTLSNNTIEGNTAHQGGGVYLVSSTADLISNTISSNTATNDGGGVYLRQSGAEFIDNTISNNAADSRGGGLYVANSNNASLSNNTISHNTAKASGANGGGGIYLFFSDATLTGNTIFSNTTAASGGGAYLHSSNATLTNNSLSSNTSDSQGGGVYLYVSGATLDNNTIADNEADNGGGGIYAWDSNDTTFSHNIISNNTITNTLTGEGGGVYLFRSDAALNDNTIFGNLAPFGAGVYINDNSSALISNTVSSNMATTSGGGLYLISSNAVLTNNLIIDNQADANGGGIHFNNDNATSNGNVITDNRAYSRGGGIYVSSSNNLTLTNNAIFDNWANLFGSGLYITDSTPHLLHNTVANNSGGDESGLYLAFDSRVILTNTIIVSHSIGIMATANTTATVNSILWHNNTTNTDGTGTIIATNTYTGDPAFAGDGYHLTGISAALGRGIDAGIIADIDGEARGAPPDLGADEYITCYAQVSSLPGVTYNVLQEAIETANPGDTVKVAGYCSDINGQFPPGGYSGSTVITQVVYITKELTLQGGYTTTNWLTPDPTANPTILDAQGRGRVLFLADTINNAAIAGFRLTNGDATGLGGAPGGGNDSGGGIYVLNATVTLSNNQIYSNTAHSGGGAFFFNSSDTTLNRNVLANNWATNRGGGLALGSSEVSLVNNAVVANQADQIGTGIWLVDSTADLIHNTIASNSGGDGSGLYVTDISGNSAAILTNTILVNHSVGITVTAGNGALLESVLFGNATNVGGPGTTIVNNPYGGNPEFTADGYHVTSASDALNRGIDAGVTTDIDGESRDAQPDLGADEASPLLTLSKTGPIDAAPGDLITYTLTVTNSGTATATNLLITDTIPANANYVSGGTQLGNAVGWNVASLGIGESISQTFSVTATQTITNNAYQIKADGNIEVAGEVSIVTVIEPALTIDKTGPVTATAGGLVTYTLNVTNNGGLATNLIVVDNIPNQANYVSGGTQVGNEIRWTIPSLGFGASITRTFSVTANQTITNSDYTVTADGGAGAIGTVVVVTEIEASADDTTPPAIISLSPVNGSDNVLLGDPIIVNFSEAMDTTSVVYSITPALNGPMSIWSNGDTRLTITHDSFAPGTSYTVTISDGSDLAGNPLANVPHTAVFTTTTAGLPQADLSVDKVASSDMVTAGGRVTYTLTITNDGPTTPITVTATDTWSPNVSINDIAFLPAGCSGDLASSQITCTLTLAGVTPVVQNLTIALTTSATFSGTLTNEVLVSLFAGVVDPTPDNNVTSVETTVTVPTADGRRIYLPIVSKN